MVPKGRIPLMILSSIATMRLSFLSFLLNNLTTTWTARDFGKDIDGAIIWMTLVTFPPVPSWGWHPWYVVKCLDDIFAAPVILFPKTII